MADRFRGFDESDLAGSFRAFLPAAGALITMGQSQAIAIADAYVAAHMEFERGERSELVPPREPGRTVDGRSVEAALIGTRAKTYLALKQGKPTAQALAFARFSASRVALTETMDAAREEVQQQMDSVEVIAGWRWQSSGRTCLACLAADNGRVRPTSTSLQGHPGCDCVQEIVYKDVRERVQRPTGEQRFKAMSAAEQDAMYGEKAELLRSGDVPFDIDHIVQRERNNDWRPVITEAPLEDLTT